MSPDSDSSPARRAPYGVFGCRSALSGALNTEGGHPYGQQHEWRDASRDERARSLHGEQFDAFGERLMPVLKDVGVELSGEPEMLEIHNIIQR